MYFIRGDSFSLRGNEVIEILKEFFKIKLGFGRPQTVNQIIYNSPHEATLILRDSLTKGEYIDIMDFPMPSCLIKDGFYTGQVIVTLVYDPFLDPSQGAEYCQSNLDVKFGSYDSKAPRDVTKRNILNPVGRAGGKNLLNSSLYSKRRMNANTDEFALRERLLIKYSDKYYPVKKYAVDFSELTDSNAALELSRWDIFVKLITRRSQGKPFFCDD